MSKGFSYTLLKGWQDCDRGRSVLEGLKPYQKLLFLSDGSLTLELELLYGSMVEVELRFKGITPLPQEAALYLDEEPEELSMEREVWLTINGRRLVYAHSIIPICRVDGSLKESLERYSDEPLGRVLTTNKVFFTKERLETGVVKCASAALDLGVPETTPLAARRYILSNRESSGKWVIKAALTEIFSPELIQSPKGRAR